jgi:SAM-dependent methyltransferase
MPTRALPWWGKFAIKAVLTRLPVEYRTWKRLGLIQFGRMEEPTYAFDVFQRHWHQFRRYGDPSPGFVSLEIGPGDSLFSAVISKALGGSRSYLMDVHDIAQKDVSLYQRMAAFLTTKQLPAPDLAECQSFEQVLERCSAQYLTSGLASLRAIPDRSVDFVWSHGAIQSIRRSEFMDNMRELRRIIRPGGVCSHLVDLRDMLAEALNHLRFSPRFWEGRLVAGSGFYTNRIRFSEMLDLFRQAGFEPEVVETNRWPNLPTPRERLAPEFDRFSDRDLCVSVFQAVLRPVPLSPEATPEASHSGGTLRR